MTGCPFCEIAAGRAPANIVAEDDGILVITPRRPVVPGHLLIIPTVHVVDFIADPAVAARCMRVAARLAQRPANLITSAGREATQTVFHLHLHVVPRHAGDGLALPWT